jgi:hypothetical protein
VVEGLRTIHPRQPLMERTPGNLAAKLSVSFWMAVSTDPDARTIEMLEFGGLPNSWAALER